MEKTTSHHSFQWKDVISVVGFTGIIVALIGLALLVLGIKLITLGGSFYYAVAGTMLILSGISVAIGRRQGLWIY